MFTTPIYSNKIREHPPPFTAADSSVERVMDLENYLPLSSGEIPRTKSPFALRFFSFQNIFSGKILSIKRPFLVQTTKSVLYTAAVTGPLKMINLRIEHNTK